MTRIAFKKFSLRMQKEGMGKVILEYGERFALGFLLCFLLCCIFGRKHMREKGQLVRYLLLSYLCGVTALALLPRIDFGTDSETGKLYLDLVFPGKEMDGVNLIPFRSILAQISGKLPELGPEDRVRTGLLNLFGNPALFLPVGFLLPLSADRWKRLHSALLFAAVFGIALEFLQFLIGRTADIDDVLLRLAGTAVGFGIWKIIEKNSV